MNNLRKLREARGLKQQDMATICNVSKSTYSYWEQGAHEPDSTVLVDLARYFGVSVDYLLGVSHDPVPYTDLPNYPNIFPISTQRIPLLGEIACGKPIFANEDRESYIMSGTNIKADFCLKAKGDSMIGARIHDGDIIFVKKQPTVDNGEIAVVIIGDEVTLKRFYYYEETQKLVLQSESPKYEPFVFVGKELESVRVLGKAIAFQSDLS